MKEFKKYSYHADVPCGEWVLISNARGGLYGYRWPDCDDEIYITRAVFNRQDEAAFNGQIMFDDDMLPGMAKFLSGKYGFDSPGKLDFDGGHPCYGSHEDVPLDSWYMSAFNGGCISCYRFPDGILLVDNAFYPAGEDHGPPPEPLFYLEEYPDVIRFFAGKDGLEALDEVEGGLAR